MKRPMINRNALVSLATTGYVVYDLENHRLHELNATASLLLELCDGQHTVDELILAVSAMLNDTPTTSDSSQPPNSPKPASPDQPTSSAETAVRSWISTAQDAGLVVDSQDDDSQDLADHQTEWTTDRLITKAAQLREAGAVQAAFICQEHAIAELSHQTEVAEQFSNVLHQERLATEFKELGELGHIIGRRNAARDAFERYLELEPNDAEIRHLLTSLRDEAPPERVPDDCIRHLYRRFASFYESNMCDELVYEGPENLGKVVDELLQNREQLTVLDLGCGTGLAGSLVRWRATRLVGIDLSPEMIDQARQRNLYDELHVAEVTGWLKECTDTFDLILACDTLIYFGSLNAVLQASAGCLNRSGIFAFSVEETNVGNFRLTDSGRYVHHRSHIESAASFAGLKVDALHTDFLRMEYGQPVDGLYVGLSHIQESHASKSPTD